MPTSGNFSTSNTFIKYRIVVTESNVDVNNNTSVVNVKVQAWRTNQGYTTLGAGTCYANIDGENFSQAITGSQTITYNSYTTLLDKTKTITHDADGKRQIYVSAYISHERFSSSSQGFNVTLTDIPRKATIISATDFNDTDNPTINYSNSAGNAATSLQACISVDGTTASVAYRDINKTGASYTFNLTAAERNTLLAATPNSNTLAVYFIIKTVIGGNTYYSSLQKTMTVKDGNPTISGASYADVNATTLAITGNNQQLIQNFSSLTLAFTSLAANKGASLARLKIKIDAETEIYTLSGTTADNVTVNWGAVNSTVDTTAEITVTDTRGNETTATINLTLLEWFTPTAIIALNRKDNYYTETYLKVTSAIAYLDGHNAVTIQYQYKEKSAATYSALTSIQDDTQITLQFDNTKAYDVRVIVSDVLGSKTYNLSVQIGIPILFIDRMLRSVGVGCIPSEPDMFSVDRKMEIKNANQEKVAEFTTIDEVICRTAQLNLENQNGNKMLSLQGFKYNGGYIEAKNQDGNTSFMLSTSDIGGELDVADANGDNRAVLIAKYINNHGTIYRGGILTLNGKASELIVNNSNNEKRIYGFISSYDRGNLYFYDENDVNRLRIYGDGGIVIYDANSNTQIDLSGSDGKITGKQIRQSNGLPKLFNGTLSSGNTTFSADYSAFVIIGRVTSGGSLITSTIPTAFLSSTSKRFQIADESYFLTYDLSINNNTATLAIANAPNSGAILGVYGLL